MLKITIPENEMWDEANNKFVSIKETTLSLEHSLVSISKWESKYKKSFISSKDKTPEELLDYIKFMTLTQNVPDTAYAFLTRDNIEEINNYIGDPMTATTISDNGKRSREIITSELIYYWMFANQIPKECEKWHINRLMTLIGVFGAKNAPDKKMTKAQTAKRYAALNAQRRAKLHSKG